MKSYFKYLTQGLLIFFLVDIISSLIMMMIWNTLVKSDSIPSVNFVQCLGFLLIFDIFTIVSSGRKEFTKMLDEKLEK